MKVMVVGNGGREHAIAWKVAQNPRVEAIYCVPGNAGTYFENKCRNIKLDGIDEMLRFALEENIELTIVGPEIPLVDGIVDRFKENGLKIFGPSKYAAQLEGSKIFSKNFMKKYGVKTAEYKDFEDLDEAEDYIKSCKYPVVIKADGLAAGKGVVICECYEEASNTLKSFMVDDIFKGSGKRIVIEEFLVGVEASILSITDGERIIPFVSAKDHKAIFDGNKGPNTGGMGAIAPNPYCTDDVLKEFERDIMIPTLNGIKAEKMDYVGIIFFGVMITKDGTYLLEYNVRLGDPETQSVLPLMESDFVDLILAAVDKKLSDFELKWKEGVCCNVVAASEGYPGSYKKGLKIEIDDNMESKVFMAGAEYKDGAALTSGGRVLCVSAYGKTLAEARAKAYQDLTKVSFPGLYHRTDIGL